MRFLGLIFLAALLVVPPMRADAGYVLVWRAPSNPGPSAREQAGRAARQQVNAAQANFARAYAEAMRNHPLNEDLRAAKAALVKARIDCDQVVRNTRAKVGDVPEVREQRRQIERLERDLDAAKGPSERIPAASDLMQARSKLTQVEAAALSEDVYVTLARAGVQEATNKLRALEEEYQFTLRNDPGFAAAKQQLDAARAQLLSRPAR